MVKFISKFALRHLFPETDFRFKVSVTRLTLAVSVFLVVFENGSFWMGLAKALGRFSLGNVAFLLSVFVSLVVLLNLGLTLICFKYTTKITVIFILIASAIANYFMAKYGIMIDKSMIQNVFQTDRQEAFELISMGMLPNLMVLGLAPAVIVKIFEINYKPLAEQIKSKVRIALISLVVVVVMVLLFYKEYSLVGRNNRHLRHLINPVNYIYALGCNIKRAFADDKIVVQPIGEDAKLETTATERGKSNILILVVGETARAANFSLNGYARETNPLLAKEDIINFGKVYSCGTATATSLPCMFSAFGRDSYSDSKGKRYEGLLDVLSRAGVNVLWRDNNSGCKGVCKRVETEDLSKMQVEGLCSSGECHDMILLHHLQDYVDKLKGDAVIVLHQKGSHGPAYYLRSPDEFKAFVPECRSNQPQVCSDQEIVNAYDNTIVYTDYFLSQVIGFLKNNSLKHNTAMIYVSDHGESLGENNIYLHGMPYLVAPDEQRHIPLIMWLSKGFEQDRKFDGSLLRQQSRKELSHDNLFHSVLGMMGVKTKTYEAGLDIFAAGGR